MTRSDYQTGEAVDSSSHPLLILASGSPQRRRLLDEAGYRFVVLPPDDSAEDQAPDNRDPVALVKDLALRKARDVAQRVERGWIVAADTVAECDGEILGKPADEEDARRMLRALSGREHRVLSGLAIVRQPKEAGGSSVRIAETRLRMDDLSEESLEAYLQSGQWRGKAGAFGLQDRLGWVRIEQGSESNVIGLPMELLAEMLTKAGFEGPPNH